MSWVVEWASETPHSTIMNKQPDILERKSSLIKIAIDMHLRSYRVVRQIDHSTPQPAQKFWPLAIAAADPAHAGDGTQPLAAKGNGGERALVGRHNLGANCPGDAALGNRAAGELEKAHRTN